MNYTEALDYIHSTKKFTTKQDLTRIFNLLHEMGDPHKKMHYVHIAGTNGKGSATAMSASVLQTSGMKTGMFISPYLERFNERMQIDGAPIADNTLAHLVTDVVRHVDAMDAKDLQHVTEFELLTAVAFGYWAAEGCDWVALEVGMGGRLDATNVIDAPDVAIITSISHDHGKYLGATIGEIAYEKCGIIKPGSTVVSYARQHPDALRVIERVCAERGAELITPDASKVVINEEGLHGSTFAYCGVSYDIPLIGRHQTWNAVGVIEAMKALQHKGYSITDADISNGLRTTKWVGRLEAVCANPYTLIDAAHNPDAIDALCGAIDAHLSGRKIVAVMGMVADKDYNYCIPKIASRSHAFVAVTPESNRALAARETAAVAKAYCDRIEWTDSIYEGIDRAFQLAEESGSMVLVCGSLFIIGHAKTYISERYK